MKLSSRRDALAFAMALSGLAASPMLTLARGVQFRVALTQFKQEIHQFLGDWPGLSREAIDDLDRQVALG